jgi:nicotinamide-nucleotide amidase
MSNIAAAIITIGDELLIGQTIDTNSAWIARHLNELGIDVIRRVAVGDNRAAIVKALDEEIAGATIVLITGGLGPTSDDITKPLLSEYFGGKLVVNERVLAHLKEIFTKRNRPFLERNMKQAEVPENCSVLFNKMGTAPGMMFQIQNSKFKIQKAAAAGEVQQSTIPIPNSQFLIPDEEKVIIAMPGVPFEMMSIMQDEVLPVLRERFFSDALFHRTIVTAGEGESFIAEKIQALEEALPGHIKLAYLPDAGMVKLRLTGRGKDKELLSRELEARQGEIADLLGDIVVARDDVPMEKIIGDALLANGKMLGLAESCTGGFIGHLVTQVNGSSKYFNGSIVSYSNDVKHNVLGVRQETIDNCGAVSEQTVTEMAKGALRVLNSDYALAVSGVLGPQGGTERVPVGTVWMAVADKETVKTKVFRFHYNRQQNKEMAAKMGMLMIWKFFNRKS